MTGRSGATIIEVLIALVVLAIAGVGLITLLAQTLTSVHQVGGRQDEVRVAATLMDRAATWSRADLELHIGSTRTGRFVLTVGGLPGALYAVDVSDTTGAMLLHTTFYRPDSSVAGEGTR
jgi:Tfp pilus assembly protein PilV